MTFAADRNTPVRAGEDYVFPVKAGARIRAGALVMLADGLARPGAAGDDLVAAGRAEARADNRDGGDGAILATVRRGTFLFANAAGDEAVKAADWGKPVYALDDETVAKSDGGGRLSPAGICRGVEPVGVWVEI